MPVLGSAPSLPLELGPVFVTKEGMEGFLVESGGENGEREAFAFISRGKHATMASTEGVHCTSAKSVEMHARLMERAMPDVVK